MEDVLFLITARSGSKGFKNKNIKKLFGIPLIGIRGLSALKLTSSEHVWLSTDSSKYASIGEKYNIYIPFIRPNELASDFASSADVVIHAMNYAERIGKKYKYIALLEPTSPLVYTDFLKDAILKLKSDQTSTAIVATKKVEVSSIFTQKNNQFLTELADKLQNISKLRRQDFEDEITPAGGFYISKWDDYLKNKTFYTSRTLSYNLPEECSIEIDNEIQYKWADFLVKKKFVDINKII